MKPRKKFPLKLNESKFFDAISAHLDIKNIVQNALKIKDKYADIKSYIFCGSVTFESHYMYVK